jgi:hypothetical protein
MTYIAYHVAEGQGIPVAVADNHQAAFASGALRILSAGMNFGEVCIREFDDLSDDAVFKLKSTLDKFFAERGIA